MKPLIAIALLLVAAPAFGQVTTNSAITGQASDATVTSAQLSTLLTPIANPTAPTITQSGTAGSTAYSYKVSARVGTALFTAASTATATATGNATLTGTNYNVVSWAAVSGATSYDVYRTASAGTPATTGFIGNTTALSFNDTGIAADSTNYAAAGQTQNITGGMLFPGALVGNEIQAFSRYNQLLQSAVPGGILTAGRFAAFGIATNGNVEASRINGTLATPTTILSGDTFGLYRFSGYNPSRATGAGFLLGASIAGVATENWANATSAGSKIVFNTTPNGTLSVAPTLTLEQDRTATFAGKAKIAVFAFAALETCGSSIEGAIAGVSDSSTATWGATITNGGSNHVLAYCNGTNWTVAGK